MCSLQHADDARGLAITGSRLVSVGRIAKVHGTNGGVVLVWHDSPALFPPELEEGVFLFIAIEGLPVPYQLAEAADREDGSTLLRLRRIETPEEARALCHAEVLMLRECLPLPPDGHLEVTSLMAQLAGTPLIDQHGATVGCIRRIETYSLNVLLVVETDSGQERMVPFHQSLILNPPAQPGAPLQLSIPEGLEDL